MTGFSGKAGKRQDSEEVGTSQSERLTAQAKSLNLEQAGDHWRAVPKAPCSRTGAFAFPASEIRASWQAPPSFQGVHLGWNRLPER